MLRAGDALVVRVGERWSRVRSPDPDSIQAILAALRSEGRLAAVESPSGAVKALVELGALVPVPHVAVVDLSGCAGYLTLPSFERCDRPEELPSSVAALVVVLASRHHPALGSALSAVAQRDAVIAFTSRQSVVVARSRPTHLNGCARCAWLGDVEQVGAVAPISGTSAEAHGAEGWLSKRAAQLVDQLLLGLVDLSPGHALAETLGDGARVYPIMRHPACTCWQQAEPTTHVTWDSLCAQRFAPVWPVERGDEDGRPTARVVLRRSSKGHIVSSATLGVALGSGPQGDVRALAESIERSSMHHAAPELSASAGRDLESAWDPATIRSLLYRAEERADVAFRYPDYDEDVPVDWTRARALGEDTREALVPAALVGHVEQDASRLLAATSNGYACHHDRTAAEVAALLELIERDAILLGWFLQRPWIRLADVGSDRDVYLCTQDIDLPVVLACGSTSDGSLRCGSAAATGLRPAVERALAELDVALAGRNQPVPRPPLDRADVQHGPEDHVACVSGGSGRSVRDELRQRSLASTSNREDRWPGDAGDAKEQVHSALSEVGLEPWIVDRSMPAVFGPGWHVVRALIPGVVELSFGLGYRRLASPRIARALAFGESLNPDPHPLG